MDSFLAEAKAKKIRTLEELNQFWDVWVEEYYHNKPHDGIRQYYVSQGWDYPEEGISPLCEWKNDSRRLRYLDTDAVAQAFLHHTQRLVDKGGCISLFGRQYEVSTALIGAKVEVSYDPMLLDTVTVRYQGVEPITAHPLVINLKVEKYILKRSCLSNADFIEIQGIAGGDLGIPSAVVKFS